MRPLLPLTVAIGCSGAPDGEPDSGTTHDTATATGIAVGGTLDLVAPGAERPSLDVAIVHVTFGDGPAFGDTLAFGAATGDTWSLTLPVAAPPDHVAELQHDLPDVTGAFYAVLAYADDGDGAWTEGEDVAGAAVHRWLAWVDGHAELDTGWHAVDLGLEGQYAANRCLTDTTVPLTWAEDTGFPTWHAIADPIAVPLRGVPGVLELGGTIASVPDGVSGLTLIPYKAATGDLEGAVPVLNLPAEVGPFAATLAGPPPDSHNHGSDPDWRYTVHVGLLYDDTDQSGAWTDGDAFEGTSTCVDGQWVYVRYTRAVHSWKGVRLLDCYGGSVGWRVVTTDPDTDALTYLSAEDAARVEVDPDTCRL